MEKPNRTPQPTQIMSNPTMVMPTGKETLVMGDEPNVSTAADYVHLGSVLGERYTLTRVLSDNTGEAALFVCEHQQQEYVAKIYHANKQPKPELTDLIRSIDCPNVIQILDAGEIERRYYEILPYYREGDLLASAPIDPTVLLEVVVPSLVKALAALHEKGIVHRDIKPNNLFFSEDRKLVVVGDFGISSMMDDRQSVRFTSGSRTLGYSAPETSQGFVSKESDYYSLGITLLHLVTGFDPFTGMNEQQILKITLTDKLQIPSNLHPRIAHLIRGLTVKERSDRWGEAEIRKWCKGETVPVHETNVDLAHTRPYSFYGRKITDRKELTLAFAERWGEATKHLYRGLISEYVKQFGQDLASEVMDCEEERDQDLGTFKMLYVLSPQAPLAWKGEIFFDLQAFGEALHKRLAGLHREYLELLQKGALLHFLNLHDFNEELVKEVKALEVLATEQPGLAYYKLYFLLRNTDEFRFDHQTFHAVNELVDYLHVERGRIEELSKRLLRSSYFEAWLEHLGYKDHLEQWRGIQY